MPRVTDDIKRLLLAGVPQAEVARRTGRSKSTVSWHARRLGVVSDGRSARRYDWTQVQAYYDAGHSITRCQERFGFSRQAWNLARRRGLVTARPQAMPIEQLLAGARNRSHLKARLLRAGLKENRCEACGIDQWLAAPLSMALHHVNGDGSDNRLENLQMLCPNCHSQTENFAGRGKRPAVAARTGVEATGEAGGSGS